LFTVRFCYSSCLAHRFEHHEKGEPNDEKERTKDSGKETTQSLSESRPEKEKAPLTTIGWSGQASASLYNAFRYLLHMGVKGSDGGQEAVQFHGSGES
jgi:hypothetical protein